MTERDHANSYYLATAKGLIERPALEGEVSCDVAVVGGGLTGLSAALHLAERGYDTILLETRRIAWGASGRNGGQLNTGQRQDPMTVARWMGSEDSRRLWDLAEEAKTLVRGLIAKHEIACDLKDGHISAAWKPGDTEYYHHLADNLQRDYDYPAIRALTRAEIGEMLGSHAYHGGALDTGAAHLHPLNYALGLARAAEAAGARLFENSPVAPIDPGATGQLSTPRGTVKARNVVLACNGYLDRLEGRIAGNIMPINNFIIATEPLSEDAARALIRDDVAVSDSKFVVDYYRLSADRRLLFGGGESYGRELPKDITRIVRRCMLRVFPQLAETRIDYAWGGTLAITLNRLPDVGRLSGDIYYAQGFSGQGLALTSLLGKLLAEAIAGTNERFDIFARIPTRRFPGGTLLRRPGQVLGMLYYSLQDKL
jgi:gamma-glutamylputrescine oxidase